MKSHLITFLVILLLSLSANLKSQEHYFYSKSGEKISFEKVDSIIFVKFNEKLSSSEISSFVAKKSLKPKFISDKVKKEIVRNNLISIKNKSAIDSLLSYEEIDYADYVLKYKDGTIQGANNQVIVKLNPDVDFSVLSNMSKKYNIIKIDPTSLDNKTFILTLSKNSINTLELSRIFFETNKFEYCEPNFIRFIKPSTNDPFYNQQWSLRNIGQHDGTVGSDIHIEDAWTITKGCSNIKVAVCDEGVDLTHPDLINNLLPGYDATGGGSNGGPSGNDAHGTNCAGIIAAEENTIGIVGIAPKCKIIPIRIAHEVLNAYGQWTWETTDTQIADGLRHAWDNSGADIISNSWGGGSPSTTITNEINNAVNSGRGNKGCIVVFAAGNYNTSVNYPATLSNVISVGATSMCDQRKRSSSNSNEVNPGVSTDPKGVSCDNETWWGSNYGTNLDVVAPGVLIYSTDIQGSAGYNTSADAAGDYNDHFNGTSSACPHVSGVLALILSINPNLSQTQARNILETTTDKIGGYSYSTNSNQPNGTWNNEVGYGRINAFRAVTTASSGFISGSTTLCASGTPYTLNNIYPGSTISWSSSTNISLPSNTNVNPVTAYATGIATGWVRAMISTNGCVVNYAPFSVRVGLNVSFSGPSTILLNQTGKYTGSASCGPTPYYYYWWLRPELPSGIASRVVSTSNPMTLKCSTYAPASIGTGTVQPMSPINPKKYFLKLEVRDGNGNYVSTTEQTIFTYGELYSISPLAAVNGEDVQVTSLEEDYFVLSPNPATSSVDVSITNTMDTESTYTVKILSSSGVPQLTTKGKETHFTLQTSNLKNGTYLVEVSNGKEMYRKQLIIQR